MITVRRLQLGEGALFKQIRLAALRESPTAFSSTYASALQRSPESWREQADGTAEGSDRATFIAFSDDTPIGIAALYRDKEIRKGAPMSAPVSHHDFDPKIRRSAPVCRPATGEVLQVWVAPEYRGKGVAVSLMDAIFCWARENGFRRVLATVTRGNGRALRFYKKYGFRLVREASSDDLETVLIKEIGTVSLV